MKKIFILLVFCLVSTSIFAQSVTIQPNTGGTGNLLIKSNTPTYGHISTAGPDGADLFFRIAEPNNGNGNTGTPIGYISTYGGGFPKTFIIGSSPNSNLVLSPNYTVNTITGQSGSGLVGINTIPTNAMTHIRYNSSCCFGTPTAQLKLDESEADYARLRFTNTNSTDDRFWDIAAYTHTTPAGSAMSLFYTLAPNGGNIMTLLGDGKMGVLTTPLTTFNVGGGNSVLPAGNGDAMIGDGNHSLNMGVTMAGGTTGESRIFAKSTATPKLILGYGTSDVLTINGGSGGFVSLTKPFVMGSILSPISITNPLPFSVGVTGDNKIVGTFYSSGNSSIALNAVANGTGSQAFVANGFSQLGSAAPAIQMKKLTGTTAGTQNGVVSIAHGLSDAKIIDINVLVEWDGAGGKVPARYNGSSGYEFSFYTGSGVVSIVNSTSNSSNILNKPIIVVITYEQ